MAVNPASPKKARADLLRAVARRELGLAPSPTAIQRRGQYDAPLSYAQSRVWFIDQLQPGSPLYNVPLALRLIGRLDREAMHASLSEIVRRHEVLRTTFAFVDGSPIQRVQDVAPVPMPMVDLTTLEPEEREQEAQRRIQEESQRPFDLSVGPLFRPTLLR